MRTVVGGKHYQRIVCKTVAVEGSEDTTHAVVDHHGKIAIRSGPALAGILLGGYPGSMRRRKRHIHKEGLLRRLLVNKFDRFVRCHRKHIDVAETGSNFSTHNVSLATETNVIGGFNLFGGRLDNLRILDIDIGCHVESGPGERGLL